MEIFSEIYGQYYRVMSRLLKNGKQTLSQMRKTIDELGYGETALYFEPNIMGENWPLFKKHADGTFEPIIKNVPSLPPTAIEKAWLKSVLKDERAKLFYTDEEIAAINEKLIDVEPLYKNEHIIEFDQFDAGDDYADEKIRKHFALLLEAAQKRQVVKINYLSAKGKVLEGAYAPCKFEYSPKNDKIRCLVVLVEDNECTDYTILNLGRIQSLELIGEAWPKDIDSYFASKRLKSERILEVELSDERNARERFMVEFSNYRKEAVFDKERELLLVTMWYDSLDETEILVKLLGFGPVLKVLGPENLVEQIKKRLRTQKGLTEKFKASAQ